MEIKRFFSEWEDVLNSDEELQLRNRDKASTLEGKVAIQLGIEGIGQYHLLVHEGKFSFAQGPSPDPLLCWDLPVSLLKEVLLNQQPVFYGLLDERGSLSFNTPHFTHFNGASIIEMLYLAQELVKSNDEIQQWIQQLGE